MTYLYNFPNATNPDDILVQVVTGVHNFVPMFLFFIFMLVGLGGSKAQEQKKGYADWPLWFTVAGLCTTIISAILGIVPGLISLGWTIVVVVVTILCGFWLFLDRRINEA